MLNAYWMDVRQLIKHCFCKQDLNKNLKAKICRLVRDFSLLNQIIVEQKLLVMKNACEIRWGKQSVATQL